jgi:hypothetical protein
MTIQVLDKQDLQFFETHMPKVEAFGIVNVFEDRDDRIRYRNISKLVHSTIVQKTTVIKKKRVPLTAEEIVPVLAEYLLTYTENGKVKVFDRIKAAEGMQDFRKNKIATAMALHGQIVMLDKWNDTITKSFDRYGKTLMNILKGYNQAKGVDRFDV